MKVSVKPSSAADLLFGIVEDNLTVPFPVNSIEEYYTALYMFPHKFEDLFAIMTSMLKNKFSEIVSHTFIVVMAKYFNSSDEIREMITEVYLDKLEKAWDSLLNTQITFVPKESPDGEVIQGIEW